MAVLSRFANSMFTKAMNLNREVILDLVEPRGEGVLADLGCNDGLFSLELSKRMGATKTVGVEVYEPGAQAARANGLDVTGFDLNGPFDLETESLDVVHANQVIEHLWDTDVFLQEIYRVLKPGGYTIISTENASSWCNVASSALGWQPFSLTNFSTLKLGIGNPLALHREDDPVVRSWCHVRILTTRALREYLEVVGFEVDAVGGAGYFPLPARLGRLHPSHAHFITVRGRKPA